MQNIFLIQSRIDFSERQTKSVARSVPNYRRDTILDTMMKRGDLDGIKNILIIS